MTAQEGLEIVVRYLANVDWVIINNKETRQSFTGVVESVRGWISDIVVYKALTYVMFYIDM